MGARIDSRKGHEQRVAEAVRAASSKRLRRRKRRPRFETQSAHHAAEVAKTR